MDGKYVVLYALGVVMPTRESSSEFNGGAVAYRFTIFELENFTAIGSFSGSVENADEFSYTGSIEGAARMNLGRRFKDAVEEEFNDNIWSK